MNTPFLRHAAALGVLLGVATFVAVGLFVTIGAVPNAAPAAPTTTAQPPNAAVDLSRAFADVAKRVRPAVVGVYSERMVRARPEVPSPFNDEFFRRFFGVPGQPGPGPGPGPGPDDDPRMPQQGMGSGMVIDREGHILTNYHVVGEVDEIQVRFADQRSFEAEIVGVDPPSDVAVIRIKGKVPEDLATVTLGDSDSLEVGHLVMAIGAPFGYLQTVTTGVLSAKDRSGIGINDYEDFLQTDAAINPGNSGGPLVNMSGEVVGINSAIATSIGQFAGVGFAIPINMVRSMLPSLLAGKAVSRGQLGVVIQPVTPELAAQFGLEESRGALIAQVNPDSPAAKAGLEVGDVIVAFQGRPVNSVPELRNLVASTAPGTRVEIEAVRDGRRKTFKTTLGTLQAETETAARPDAQRGELDDMGLVVQTLTPSLASQLGYEGEKGVVVMGVTGGPAARAGLQRGDLILEAGRKPVTTADDLRKAITAAGKDEDNVLLRIKRREASLFVVLPLK